MQQGRPLTNVSTGRSAPCVRLASVTATVTACGAYAAGETSDKRQVWPLNSMHKVDKHDEYRVLAGLMQQRRRTQRRKKRKTVHSGGSWLTWLKFLGCSAKWQRRPTVPTAHP